MAATWAFTTGNLSGLNDNPAGASLQTPWFDFTDAYEGYILAEVQNQAAAATTGATVTCDVSGPSHIDYVGAGGIVQSGSGAGAIFAWKFDGLEGSYARVNFSGNLGNTVSVIATGRKLTGI
jgi:hypothetical protein